MAQQVNGATTTYYLGALEELTGTTLTKCYDMADLGTAVDVGGTLSYLASDGLSSVSEALSASGTATSQQLFAPYGATRCSSGTMPTAKGFTGQRADNTTGLDYYNARYYDPTLGLFGSGDSVAQGGLNRYAYVGDNPETRNDPSGHCWIVCAIVAAVATTVVSAVVQQVTTGQVNWGQAVTQGLFVGATIALGPAGGALADAIGGGIATMGASVAAGNLAGTAIVGGVLGAGEGVVQGVLSGDRGGDLLRDGLIGGASGVIGGALGYVAGGIPRTPLTKSVVSGIFAGAGGNFAQQELSGAGFNLDGASFLMAGFTGGLLGHFYGSGEGSQFAAEHPFAASAAVVGTDFLGQGVVVPFLEEFSANGLAVFQRPRSNPNTVFYLRRGVQY